MASSAVVSVHPPRVQRKCYDCAMENVTVRFDPDDIAQIDREATREKRARSQMIRVLVAEALAARAPRSGSDKPDNALTIHVNKRGGQQ